MLREHIDVREVGQPRIGRVDRAGEADLSGAPVEADDAVRTLDQAVHLVPRPAGRPVRLLRDEAVHLVEIDPSPVVVELVAA